MPRFFGCEDVLNPGPARAGVALPRAICGGIGVMRVIRTWTSRFDEKGNEVTRVLLGVAMATFVCGGYADASVYAEIKDVWAGSTMSAGNTVACDFNFDVVADDNRYRPARPVFIQGSIFALTKNGHLALGLSIAPGDVPNHQSKPAAFFDPRYVWVAGEGKDTVGKEFRIVPRQGGGTIVEFADEQAIDALQSTFNNTKSFVLSVQRERDVLDFSTIIRMSDRQWNEAAVPFNQCLKALMFKPEPH